MCIVGLSSVHITSSALRALLLFFNGFAFVAWIWVRFNNLGLRYLWLALQALVFERRRKQWEEETLQRSEYYWKINMQNGGFIRWYIDDTFASTVFSARRAVQCMSRVWIALRIARCQRAILSLLFITYQISVTETFIKVNLDKRANEWGYGQITALILTGPPVMTLLRLVVGAVQHNDEYGKSEGMFRRTIHIYILTTSADSGTGPIEFEKMHHEFYYLYYLCRGAVKSPFHPTRGDSGGSFDCVETRRSPPPSTVELRQMSVPEGETADPTDDDDMAPLLSPPPVAAAKAHRVGR